MKLLLYGHLYVVALLICAFLLMGEKNKGINARMLFPCNSFNTVPHPVHIKTGQVISMQSQNRTMQRLFLQLIV